MASKFRNASKARISFFSFQDIITSVTGILLLITLIMVLYVGPAVQSVTPQTSAPSTPATQIEREIQSAQTSNSVLQAQLNAAASATSAEVLRKQLERLRLQEAELASQAGVSQDRRASKDEMVTGAQKLEAVCEQLEAELNRQKAALDRERRQTNQVFVIKGSTRTKKKPVMVMISGDTIELLRIDPPGAGVPLLGADLVRQFEDALSRYQTADEYFVFLVKPSGIQLFEACRALARNNAFDYGYEPIPEGMSAAAPATSP